MWTIQVEPRSCLVFSLEKSTKIRGSSTWIEVHEVVLSATGIA
jgi:hypothetical protein